MNITSTWATVVGVLGGISGVVGGAGAVPAVGNAAPADARVEDVDGRSLTVASLAGRPAVVVYEDKDSRAANAARKAELTRIRKEEPALARVQVVAVADVSAYDFWPAKSAARDAIREEQKKAGFTIWLDWTARFRDKLDLTKGASNVVLLDRKGRVAFAAAGPLGTTSRQVLHAAMRAVVQ